MMGAQSIPEPDPHAELKSFLGQVDRFKNLLLELAAIKQQAAELDRQRSEHQATIKRERAAHEAKLWADREAFDLECKQRMRELENTEAETKRLNQQAQADAQRAADTRREVEARLSRLEAAMAK